VRALLKVSAVAIFCIGLAGIGVIALSDPDVVTRLGKLTGEGSTRFRGPSARTTREQPIAANGKGPTAPQQAEFPLFSANNFETGGFGTANRFMGPVQDRGSIEEVCGVISKRAQRGIEECLEEIRSIPKGDSSQAFRAVRVEGSLIYLLMYEGKFDEAAVWAERAINDATAPGVPDGLSANLRALLGVIHLRRGETENCLDCLGPSSCIFPIAAEAVHQKTSGSREAIRHFIEYLRQRPEDVGVRWLVNVAYMTLGEYPAKVPSNLLIPLDSFRSKLDIGRFENVAPLVGLGDRGPNLAGGSVFDDFTGDGLPDIFTTSMDAGLGASFFINRGDGFFEDRSVSAGLKGQPYSVNCSQADFDNDGRLDVVMVRGGWENPARLSLLRNKGECRFEDVTVAAGLDLPIASHSAVWADFDNDGRLDLFVCGEYAADSSDGIFSENTVMVADTRNRCRLYRNKGNGTFVDIAEQAGVCNDRYAKAAVCIDYDGDGLPDIYVSNFGQKNRLYHNRGDWTFEDLAPTLGVTEPLFSFTCGVLDFDNDGRLDILVTDYSSGLNEWAMSALGLLSQVASHPRLFRNLGAPGFKDVSLDTGLDKAAMAMGMGVGDIDNDGFLDLYLGTGRPGYSGLVPNMLYKNCAGQRFEDITESSGTGHLQKGHGASFADWDCDGDADLFVEVGGAVPGDKANNLLFQNPGHGRHWLKVRLAGTQTNRSAIGAKMRVDMTQTDGKTRSVYRTIGSTSSYGGSTLVETIGLDDAKTIASITVTWPVSRTTQTFHNLTPDTAIEVTEGSDVVRLLKLAPLPAPPKTQRVAGSPKNPDLPAPLDSDQSKIRGQLSP
jgi:hypothetical protein